MKKLLAATLISLGFLGTSNYLKADEAAVIVKPGGAGHQIFSFNELSGVTSLLTEKAFNGGGWTNLFSVDQKLFIVPSSGNDLHVYDFVNDSWTDLGISGSLSTLSGLPLAIYTEATYTNIDIDSGSIDGTSIGSNSASTGSFTTLNSSGNSIVGGTFGVTQTTTLTGALDANGGASIDNVQIGVSGDNEIDTASGNLTIDSAGGTTTIDDALAVSGATTLTGALDANGGITTTDLTATGTSTLSSVDINGGAIDGTAIGANSASTGSFTTLGTSGNTSIGGDLTLLSLAGSGSGCLSLDNNGLVGTGSCGNGSNLIGEKSGSTSTTIIGTSTRNEIQIGTGNNSTVIDQKGISTSGINLIRRENNGEIHIGENSLITKEENGRQKVYAKDANGNPIPIDYTNGTKLLINGRDVEQSINNVGALSAALTGLPTVPTHTILACGLGTGTHGGNFAFSGGCASKINEKLSINYAASMNLPGQDYVGAFEDTFSARAGFVWQLGKLNKPTLISMNQKKDIDAKISQLENTNEKLKNENKKLLSKNIQLETKNNEIIFQNKKILARLERLESIAFDLQKTKDFRLSKSISK